VRFRHTDGSTVHLAYCSNVHPAEDVDGIIAQLGRFAAPVRRALGAPRLGIGLWLPATAAHRLSSQPAQLTRLRRALDRCRLEVVTLNGFPYKGFHAPVVKQAVYHPDWTDPERAAYTLALARVLTGLLPDDAPEGSISTLPLGWREPWDASRADAARALLCSVGEALACLADETGRRVRLALEPEPGCVLETTAQAASALSGLAGEWIGVCLDACHLAVGFEDPVAALDRLAGLGVAVVKAQVAAALRAERPDVDEERAWLAGFVEPRFLHQTREHDRNGGVLAVDDLDEALDGGLPGAGEWRVHFHAPVHAGAGTTQSELVEFLAALLSGPVPATRHLEVETYTWSVLPPGERPGDDAGLVDGLVRELAWVRSQLCRLGLEEVDH
jgi:sugar phosphate isomerase/epimerase